MIHFFTLAEKGGKRFLLTLPHQKLKERGVEEVTGDILVQPEKGLESTFLRVKKTCEPGTILWTATLRKTANCYKAGDINVLSFDHLFYDLTVCFGR